MSIISFTKDTCKNNDKILQTLINNFEEHFAMYSIANIKKIPSIEISNSKELCYIIECNNKDAEDIKRYLETFECSHYKDTLIPIITDLENGLEIRFTIRE